MLLDFCFYDVPTAGQTLLLSYWMSEGFIRMLESLYETTVVGSALIESK